MGYWEQAVPWAFKGEVATYADKRRMRYSLQDYMLEEIGFEDYRGKSVLELGSGGGLDSAEFARNGARVISVDFTARGSATTRDLLRESGSEPRVVRSSATNLPFAQTSFDCVYSFGVIHHIPEMEQAVQEISRVLKAKGDLICMLYNKNSILYAYSIMFLHKGEGTEEELVRRYSERILDCPYTKVFTKEDVMRLFEPHFEDVRINVRYNVLDLPGRRKVKFSMDDKSELGWHLVIHAKNK